MISLWLLSIAGISILILVERGMKKDKMIQELQEKLLIAEGKYTLLVTKLKEKKRQREIK